MKPPFRHLPIRYAPALFLAAAITLPGGQATTARALPSGSAGRDIRTANEAFAAVDIEAAEAHLDAVADDARSDPDFLNAEAALHFHRGRYGAAVSAIEDSLAARPARGAGDPRKEMAQLMRSTRDATSRFVQQASADGRYQVFHEPGRDALIVPYALEALERTDAALYEELGYRHPGPIRLEIYPNTRALAKVSTLTEEAIERTGTIALCKWDRLMITSPRALLRGYPWIDTIAHEYVHLVLTRMTGDHAPVWVQEGLAKLLERRWRSSSDRAPIEPAVESLLADAVKRDELIPFEKLHPSIALLPSQRDAALAFGQVATFFETYRKTQGRSGIRALVQALRSGSDARQAIASIAKAPFGKVEEGWKTALRSRNRVTKHAPRLLDKKIGDRDEDELAAMQANARRYVRLGDLLWGRQRFRAAAAEYAKAHKLDEDDPTIATRLGRAALAGGDPSTVAATLSELVKRYPQHAPTRALLSAAYWARGSIDSARENAIEAIRLNPFDPRPHCVLSHLEEDNTLRGERERNACLSLGGSSDDPTR